MARETAGRPALRSGTGGLAGKSLFGEGAGKSISLSDAGGRGLIVAGSSGFLFAACSPVRALAAGAAPSDHSGPATPIIVCLNEVAGLGTRGATPVAAAAVGSRGISSWAAGFSTMNDVAHLGHLMRSPFGGTLRSST